MKYYIAKTASGEFSAVVDRVIESLKAEGFGVLTDIDVKATMNYFSDVLCIWAPSYWRHWFIGSA